MTWLTRQVSSPRVRRCGADDVIGLRQSVLRPHLSAAEATYASDFAPATAHFCAEDGAGRVVSVASLLREAPAWKAGVPGPGGCEAWLPPPTGGGGERGQPCWPRCSTTWLRPGAGCYGATRWLDAVDFYRRAGMTTTGEPWEEPVIGPHIAMCLDIRGDGRPVDADGT